MRITHVTIGDDTTLIIPDTLLNDKILSWTAKGVYAFLTPYLPGDTIPVRDLETRFDGPSTIQAALEELLGAGYLREGRSDGEVTTR